MVEPDLGFAKDIADSGAGCMQKCYQCATCSTVCPLSSDGNPFPRKEMIWAQWGLEDKLVNDPDIWLCHQCNDCIKYCPREAKPGDLMAVLRKRTFQHYAAPNFMAKILGKPKMLPLLLAIPTIIFLVIVMMGGGISNIASGGEIVYSKFISMDYIDVVFIPLFFLAMATLLFSLVKFWKGMKAYDDPGRTSGNFINAVLSTVMDILFHTKFKECGVNKGRRIAHWMTLYGFIGLGITTTYVWIINWFMTDPLTGKGYMTPLETSGAPGAILFKGFATVSAALFIVGAILLFINRRKTMTIIKSKTTSYDWIFMVMIFLTGATGGLSVLLRIMDIATIAYPINFIHLLCVFYVLIYLPYSKLAHSAYRFTAMVYAKYTGRDS
jgi:quinone-modifying oxidoreductase subunit QmoC